MKILKPGKVEQRKFVCPRCGCVFVANSTENEYQLGSFYVDCPCCKNAKKVWWDDGEPYEEPTQSNEALLADLIHSSNAVDFDTAIKLSSWLIAHGVTFKEE